MKKLCTLLLLAFCLPMFAATLDLVTVTVTNAPTTNGQTLVIDGQTYLFTNNTANLPLKILTNTTTGGSATNVQSAISSTRPADVHLSYMTNGTNIIIRSKPGASLTVTIGGAWGYVTTDTLTVTNAPIIQVPVTIWPTAQRTNNMTQLINDIAAYASNRLATNAFFLENYISTGPDVRTLLNDIISAGHFTGGVISNSLATNMARVHSMYALITNARINQLVGPTTNTAGGQFNFALTNATGEIRGAYVSNIIGVDVTITNLSAPGAGNGSTRIGANSTAIGANAISIGATAAATNQGTVAIGDTATANGQISTAIGSEAVAAGYASGAFSANAFAGGWGSVAVGFAADSSHSNSVALGSSATTTTTNQIRLGTSAEHVSIPGELRGVNESNVITRGTNVINARVDFTPRSDTGLLDGYNTGTVLGSNVYVFLSGPTGAHTNTGFAAEQNGSFHIVQIDNPVNNFTILNNTTANGETAANRILTGTGGNLNFTNNPVILQVIYDGAASKWRLLNGMPYR